MSDPALPSRPPQLPHRRRGHRRRPVVSASTSRENRFGTGGRGRAGDTLQPNAFVRIAPDDTVTVDHRQVRDGPGHLHRPARWSLAEELDIDPARVHGGIRAGADPAFNVPFAPVQFTGGSMSTSTTLPAAARGRRPRARHAAGRGGRSTGRWTRRRCAPKTAWSCNGAKTLSYGALADAASKLPVPEKVALKDPAQFRYLGKPHEAARCADEGRRQREVRHRHAPARHAVRRGRAAAGRRREARQDVDDSAARAVRRRRRRQGVPSGVAVYATNTWAAKRGREALVIEWDEGPNKNSRPRRSAREYQATAAQAGRRGAARRGDVRGALAQARETHRRRIRAAVPGAFAHGAAQLPRRRARRWLRSVPRHADAVAGPRCGRRGAGHGSCEGQGAHRVSRRRLRPARAALVGGRRSRRRTFRRPSASRC